MSRLGKLTLKLAVRKAKKKPVCPAEPWGCSEISGTRYLCKIEVRVWQKIECLEIVGSIRFPDSLSHAVCWAFDSLQICSKDQNLCFWEDEREGPWTESFRHGTHLKTEGTGEGFRADCWDHSHPSSYLPLLLPSKTTQARRLTSSKRAHGQVLSGKCAQCRKET